MRRRKHKPPRPPLLKHKPYLLFSHAIDTHCGTKVRKRKSPLQRGHILTLRTGAPHVPHPLPPHPSLFLRLLPPLYRRKIEQCGEALRCDPLHSSLQNASLPQPLRLRKIPTSYGGRTTSRDRSCKKLSHVVRQPSSNPVLTSNFLRLPHREVPHIACPELSNTHA